MLATYWALSVCPPPDFYDPRQKAKVRRAWELHVKSLVMWDSREPRVSALLKDGGNFLSQTCLRPGAGRLAPASVWNRALVVENSSRL